MLAGWLANRTVFYYSWKGFVPPQEMEQLLEEVLQHFRSAKSSLMLQDLRTTEPVSQQIQE